MEAKPISVADRSIKEGVSIKILQVVTENWHECYMEYASPENLEKGTILFVHGAWHASWCWDNFFQHFYNEGYRVIRYDHRGHGKSYTQKNFRLMGINTHVRTLKLMFKTIQDKFEEKPILLGHSMGGLIVRKYLEGEEDRTIKAIYLAPVQRRSVWVSTIWMMTREPFSFLWANLTLSLKPVISTLDKYIHKFYTPSTTPENIEDLFAQTQDESYRVFVEMLLLDPKPKQDHSLVVAGRQDFLIKVIDLDKLAKSLDAEFLPFEGMGHNLMVEVGWLTVVSKIIAWIEGQENE